MPCRRAELAHAIQVREKIQHPRLVRRRALAACAAQIRALPGRSPVRASPDRSARDPRRARPGPDRATTSSRCEISCAQSRPISPAPRRFGAEAVADSPADCLRTSSQSKNASGVSSQMRNHSMISCFLFALLRVHARIARDHLRAAAAQSRHLQHPLDRGALALGAKLAQQLIEAHQAHLRLLQRGEVQQVAGTPLRTGPRYRPWWTRPHASPASSSTSAMYLGRGLSGLRADAHDQLPRESARPRPE